MLPELFMVILLIALMGGVALYIRIRNTGYKRARLQRIPDGWRAILPNGTTIYRGQKREAWTDIEGSCYLGSHTSILNSRIDLYEKGFHE